MSLNRQIPSGFRRSRRLVGSLLFLAIVIAILPFTNCSSPKSATASLGTETGNANSPPAPTSGPGSAPLGGEIVTDLCSVVTNCVSAISTSQCQTQVSQQSGLPQVFGVSVSLGINTLQELQAAELQGTISGSSANLAACFTSAQEIPCTVIQKDFETGEGSASSLANQLSQITECEQIY